MGWINEISRSEIFGNGEQLLQSASKMPCLVAKYYSRTLKIFLKLIAKVLYKKKKWPCCNNLFFFFCPDSILL
jgi:hypothetical protein